MSFKVTHDSLTPALQKMAAGCKNKKPILEAMGNTLVSLTIRAFTNESLRASSWPEVKKKVGAPLYKSGAMKHSIRIVDANNEHVLVGTDRFYAKFHQFGTKKMPARPFFPFDANGKLIPPALRNVQLSAAAALNKLLKP
jgi:phage gpG-like protein